MEIMCIRIIKTPTIYNIIIIYIKKRRYEIHAAEGSLSRSRSRIVFALTPSKLECRVNYLSNLNISKNVHVFDVNLN